MAGTEIKTIEIEIDGRTLTAMPNQTVIQVADAAGIYIPRFCYHKKLSIPANCRMCLVEMEKSPKAVPACATPVAPGMKVFTKSAKTLAAQRAVMEFLLINHPLDCPICDQGGECELQDLAMGYGSSHSAFDESKHCTADQDIGPLISTDMTRCIKCTRCVRFGDEIAGLRELGALGRGENTDISTYVAHAIRSEVSGNIIDLCPVGALTHKPYRFTARAWELEQSKGISPHDCVGSNLHVHTRYGKVKRVVSAENMAINQMWIADRDRYSYTGLNTPDRLTSPRVNIHGEWQTVDWETALQMASAGLHKVIAEKGADQFAALASPSATVEEYYLLQKLTRALGSPHIDHRLRQQDTSDDASMPQSPGLNLPIPELANCDAILLIGSNIQKEQPILGLAVREASLKGATILVINPRDYQFHFKVHAKSIVAPHLMAVTLQQMCESVQASQTATHPLAAALAGKQKIAVLVGALAQHQPDAALVRTLARQLAQLTHASLGYLTDGANSAGAWLAGCLPTRQVGGIPAAQIGLNAYEQFAQQKRAYLLMNVEPAYDCANPSVATQALAQADFVIALSIYQDATLDAHANVILPIVPFTETAGTYVNANGIWQSFKGAAKTEGSARPAWKVLRVLGNFLHLDGFEYASAEAVRDEVKAQIEKAAFQADTTIAPAMLRAQPDLSRIGEVPIYAIDSLVRRAVPLQKAQILMEGDLNTVHLHNDTATRLHIKEGDLVKIKQGAASTVMPITIDNHIAVDAVWVAGGMPFSSELGDLFGAVEIEKVAQ